jgi:hypothetical protein
MPLPLLLPPAEGEGTGDNAPWRLPFLVATARMSAGKHGAKKQETSMGNLIGMREAADEQSTGNASTFLYMPPA